MNRNTAKNIANRIFSIVSNEGGTTAHVFMSQGQGKSVSVRNAAIENFDDSTDVSIGITVWFGERTSHIAGNDLSPTSVETLVKKACEIARAMEPNPFALIASASLWPTNVDATIQSLNLSDTRELSVRELFDLAHIVESAGLAVPGVERTNDASAFFSRSTDFVFTSDGFETEWESSDYGYGASFIASKDGQMEEDGRYDGMPHFSLLVSPDEIGRIAGERTVRKLGAVSIKTGKMPVIFSRDVSGLIKSSLAGAINGERIYEGSSFLCGKLGERLFPEGVNIISDPSIPVFGSVPFDNECVARRRIEFVKNGVLTSWSLDLKSAKQLGLTTTGNAGTISVFYMENGKSSPEDLIARIPYGFYVTETMGHGPNRTTGDFSSGASGFLIENGKLGRPVNGATIAGNLLEMYQAVTPANDLEIGRYHSPTIMVNEMTVAGE